MDGLTYAHVCTYVHKYMYLRTYVCTYSRTGTDGQTFETSFIRSTLLRSRPK